ncbi:MAG: RNA polymerase sigma-70 factor [Bacteroidales bacterium]|nr:RNA polymerase sigma-70 factor [Bacteroidales bacterium]
MENELSYLTEKVSRSDRKAFDELFRRYYPMMLSYARLFLADDSAKDVVQDVFFSVWKNRKNLDPAKSLSRYLLKSVFNRACNYLKIRNRTRGLAGTPAMAIDEMGSAYYNPDTNTVIQHLYQADIRERLNEALDTLSPKCREVFSLSYIDELSNKQIAEQLGISVRTVESHLYSALKQLRLKLSAEKLYLLLFIIFLK